MQIEVTRQVLEAMRRAANEAHPREACGILFGREPRIDAFAETRNVHPDPRAHFEIDPQALIDAHRAMREGGAEIVGYFHSHPQSTAQPSETDRSLAAGDGSIWAIAGHGELTLWRSEKDGFHALSYAVTDA